jgi:hypothetical protein
VSETLRRRGKNVTDSARPRLGLVLVAEDEPDVAALILHHLIKDGYDASTGAEALRRAREDEPDRFRDPRETAP